MAWDGSLTVDRACRALMRLALSESLIEHDGSDCVRLVKKRGWKSRDDVCQAMLLACGAALRECPDLAA